MRLVNKIVKGCAKGKRGKYGVYPVTVLRCRALAVGRGGDK